MTTVATNTRTATIVNWRSQTTRFTIRGYASSGDGTLAPSERVTDGRCRGRPLWSRRASLSKF